MPDKTAECSGSGQSRSTAGRSKFRSNVTVAMSPCWKKKDLAVSLQMTGQDLVRGQKDQRPGNAGLEREVTIEDGMDGVQAGDLSVSEGP
ncbi:hypothetical protein ASPFODRAFT_55576 [Aspergillus luchuensis CBS 106.47]|uniref:Uncharacterized protein n=1 Tax=Aspergillus luchuensis (strain CBS 106.47) TaxID=1137211 RepID=A0A1M3TYT3_ASPLC|nr:hypothetical protein ASPFODRAFT_55576 [Aspergillus luchuensis CBS 106.47]